ncbi:RDD family protein [Nitrospina gracilis]|uniref:RDD family protein n=1 Tax=Nitrospina gracilis TaxID=35801 RepID=UPI001F2DCF81|nr:RDD family protein [Nitrospina gracilis]MCF8721361.1 putative RDD family membrane protein YckC [Nitrospina gracilis Nb-211]
MKPAGFRRRYIALLLDITVLEILGLLLSRTFLNQAGTDMGSMLISMAMGRLHEGNTLPLLVVGGFLQVILICVYFVVFTGITGQTPGKKLMGIQVRMADGQPVGFRGAAVRSIPGYLLSTVTLGLGFLLALTDPRQQALHDKFAETRVFIVG